MMTHPTIRISVSNIDLKKSRAGLALSPPIARAIPNSKLTTMTLSGLPLLISPKALVGINWSRMFFHAPPSESLSPSLAASIREAALEPWYWASACPVRLAAVSASRSPGWIRVTKVAPIVTAMAMVAK